MDNLKDKKLKELLNFLQKDFPLSPRTI